MTQADIDNGSIVDHATSQGTSPTGSVTNTSNIVTVIATQSPSLSISKSANPTTVTAAGEAIDYTFTVTNTGNLTLTAVGVSDMPTPPAGGVTATCLTLSSPAGTCSGATTTLVPGQSAVFTGTYTVSQADVDHGSIADVAAADGTSPSDTPVTAPSNPVTVDVTQSGSLSIAKAADPTTVTAAGQAVDYTFTVTNTGQCHPHRRRGGRRPDGARWRGHRHLPEPLRVQRRRARGPRPPSSRARRPSSARPTR